ncbi:MAG: Calx-beta domain-containing protein [Pirellulaceae bacterium]|nr:Calx-beta domain-containing protein [Pirellulaceae bacterium]
MLSAQKLWKWLGSSSSRGKRRIAARRRQLGRIECLEVRQLMASDFYVAPTGDDWAAGTLAAPFQTIRRALDAAQPGDTITLRGGVHQGGINIDIDNLTIRSQPGEWAVIESPLTELTDGRANSVIRYGFDVVGGRLENLEITGGYWYGVMFWDWWDPTWEAGSTHIGASGITLEGVKVHNTGVDGIKITPGANDITILNSEIHSTGRRTASSADGIDNNNGDRMVARGNYLHDIPSIGILTSGGAEEVLIEQNLVQDTAGAGIVVGYYSELEWLEPAANPGYFASIDTIARNNIVVDAGQAGIGIYGALDALVYNNTLVNAADDAQAPIQFGGYDMWVSNTAPSYYHVASVNPTVVNNIVVTNPDNHTRMVDIREGSIAGPLTLDYNLYFGSSTRGVLFIDRNLTGDGTPEQTFSQWQANYGYDTHSLVANPLLDADWHLTAASPAIGKALALAGLTDDFDGNPRLADPPRPDLGADEFGAGANLVLPPTPFGAPSLEIAARGYHDYEARTIQVAVKRHGSTADTATVQFATLDGSARAGQDYVSAAGTLTFAPGESEKTVAIDLLADTLAEGDEHFVFQLSNPTTTGNFPVRLGHQASALLTIDDTQTPLTLSYAAKWVSGDGSDITGDGSQAKPWKSLQHAADNVGPGDYVIVQPGKYWGMNLTTDGKPDARITFHALPGVEIDEPFPGQQDGINLEGADYITIEGFRIHDMPRAGLRSVNNTGVILRENIADHNAMWGILTGWSDSILVENNVTSRSQVEHGIYISNSSDDAIIRNNLVFGNNASGIQFNGDRYLPGDGIHSRNLVEGNVVYDNGRGGGAALNFDGFQDGIVRNNLIYDNHATGIVLYVGFAADSSTNNLIQNNTVVMASDARWALLMTDGSAGNTLVNNILLNKNPSRGSLTIEHNSLPARSDYNLVQDLYQLDGYGGTFAQWQAFSGGGDANSLVIPQANVLGAISSLFVDPAAGNYHLASGSPAIDVGDPTGAPAVDLYQHSRPSGAGVDLGALEAGTFAPIIQFEWSDFIAYEFIGIAEIAVTRSGDTEGTLVAQVTSIGGTAGSDDFIPVNETVIFRPGEMRKSIRVFMNDDTAIEDHETIQLDLRVVGDPTGLAPADQALIHIVSDDAWRPGQFAFAASSVTFSETDGLATITVHRTGGSSGEVSVNFATSLFTPPKQANWIKKHTDILYPTDRDTPATPGDDFLAQAGTIHFAAGQTTQTITIPVVNDLWYEGGEAFVVRLSDPTAGATLGERSQLKVRIESEDAKLPGTFVFDTAALLVTEGTPTVNVTVSHVGGANVEASVRLYHTGAGNGTTTGSAWWPSDYGSLPELLTFAPGEVWKTISIPIVDDTSTEIDEVFSIQLHSPTNDATIGGAAKTHVTIVDNESTFYFRGAIPSAYAFEAVEGSGKLPVTVVRQGSLATPASITVSASGGSAIAGVDFTPLAVTLQFAPGETSKTIDIPLLNDSLLEPKESLAVAMSGAVGAQQGSWTWSGYIVDDDLAATPGKLELSAAGYSVSEAGGMVNLTVNRTGGSAGTVTVQYRTLDGASGAPSDQTAYAGADYTGKSGTLTFAPGETSKIISLPITSDTRVEKNELFTVELRSPAGGATLGAITKGVVTIVEDDSAIELATTSYSASEGTGFVTIKLIRKGSTANAAAIDLVLSGGATAGLDYLKPSSPTIQFAFGEAEKSIQLQLIDDVLKEADEWLYLSLSKASGAALGSSLWGNLKITDND